ncbi:barstar family protein [Streptomyces sp. NBC_01239]|uniref:barstar family protein n=1 Tax=Streptomyces sp. NBC_01239 TaxID=2903792 RepID=UPI002259E8A7|nr:barstar family protein [Streptomyces sp. NBC_01239]MCX4811800.1 barstar family protein [Streptomyces sp. NBC_01239]
MAVYDFINCEEPWVVIVPQGDQLLERQLVALEEQGGPVFHLSAEEMVTPEGVFAAFARTLYFPDYFGHNWDAMVDCLDDLHGSWHGGRGIAVVIGDADLLLDAGHLRLFVSVLCQAAARANSEVDSDGEPWDRPAIAQHFAFVSRTAPTEDFASRLTGGDLKVAVVGPYVTASLDE